MILMYISFSASSLLGDGDKVLAIKLLELLHYVLVNGLSHVHNLEASLLQFL